MKNELVSVIIPTYNREKLIARSIASIQNQTYSNIEIIVVDDCSTDKTEKVIKKIKDDRIRYFKLKKNMGACYARNYGIKKSKGEYIAFQDSDDYFYPEKISKQLTNMIKNKSDIDFSKLIINDGEDIHVTIPSDDRIKAFKKNGHIDELCNGNYISTLAIFVKKNILEKYMFDESLPRFQDFDLALRIVSDSKVSFTNEVLCESYRQTDSISNNTNKLEKAVSLFTKKNYNITLEQRIRLNNWLYNILLDNVKNDNNINSRNLYNEINRLNEIINNLNEVNNQIDKERKSIEKKYNSIINSKRWKVVDKLGNFFSRRK